MDVLDGLGGHAVTVRSRPREEEHLVESVEVGGGELLERDRAKHRKYGGADVGAVVGEGRGAKVAEGRQPFADQEALQGALDGSTNVPARRATSASLRAA